MFRGNSIHTIDDKGRFIIPARFRDVMRAAGSEALMLTRMEKTVIAYSLNGWSKFEEKILFLADTSAYMRYLRRYLVGAACECACDKQGRVLIPQTLRGYAELEKDIVLVGLLDHFEIWSHANWEKETERIEADIQKGEAHLEIAKLGL
jgi:transcriptional regulator MraZ